MRLFFAIEVPPEVKARIVVAQQRMAQDLPPKGFRITKPEMLHVTLAFLGEVSADNLEELKARASALSSKTSETQLTFDGLGCFPSWKHPRVLWVGVEENGYEVFDQKAPLASLGRELADACGEFGDHSPEERVLLHVTLARTGDRLKKDDMRKVGELASADYWTGFGETRACSVVLYESTQGKSGPVQHIPLARFPLKS